MRKLSFILFSLCTSCLLFAQKGHNIQFKIDNYKGQSILIANHFGDKQYILDTLTRNSQNLFVLQADTFLNGGIYMAVFPPKNIYFEFLVDNDTQNFKLETDSTDFVGKMKVSGSSVNEIFYEDMKFLGGMRQQSEQLKAQQKGYNPEQAEWKNAQTKLVELDSTVARSRRKIVADNPTSLYSAMVQAIADPIIPPKDFKDSKGKTDSTALRNYQYRYYKAHYFDKVNMSDPRLLRSPVLLNKINFYLDRLAIQHPDSVAEEALYVIGLAEKNPKTFEYVCVTVLNKYANSKVVCMDVPYVRIIEKYYMSGKAMLWTDTKQLDKLIQRALALTPTLCGDLAPNMFAEDRNKQYQSLYDVKAKYTALFIWDYDCGHCKKEAPKVGKIMKEYANQDVKFYTMQINGVADSTWRRIDMYGMNQPNAINVTDPRRVSGFDHNYDLQSTPVIFLLDENKKILLKRLNAYNLDASLNHFLYGKEGARVIEKEAEKEDEHH